MLREVVLVVGSWLLDCMCATDQSAFLVDGGRDVQSPRITVRELILSRKILATP